MKAVNWHGKRDMRVEDLPDLSPHGRRRRAVVGLAAGVVVVTMVAAACSSPLPYDAEGSLERITGGTLRVGVSENPPLTVLDDDGGVSGREVDLIAGFASVHDATIEWTPGAESQLVEAMSDGELDVVIGGFASDSPWESEVALTREYTEDVTADGDTIRRVMATPPGENALLVALETHLAGTGAER